MDITTGSLGIGVGYLGRLFSDDFGPGSKGLIVCRREIHTMVITYVTRYLARCCWTIKGAV